MFHQPPSRFDQSLLEARQGAVSDSLWQHQSPPQVSEIIGQDGQPEAHLSRWRIDQYAVTAGGQRFLVSLPLADQAAAPITAMLNWFARLRQRVPVN